jgi:DNA-binding NarL/FixJ family response regulator
MTTLTVKTIQDPKLTGAQTKAISKLPSKSAKIRYLTAKGWSRSQIAGYLGIRYQHVRNVQITPVANPTK